MQSDKAAHGPERSRPNLRDLGGGVRVRVRVRVRARARAGRLTVVHSGRVAGKFHPVTLHVLLPTLQGPALSRALP